MYTTVYKEPRDGGATFTIVHYAGAVSYDLMGTLNKNRDTLPNAILYTMKSK
jgi:myosin-3/myosin XVI